MGLSAAFLQGLNPGNVIDIGNQQAQQQAQQLAAAQQQSLYPAQQAMANIGVQNATDELANKRRMMAVSMLNGIGNEPDPAKQQQLYSTLKPMAERYDPTLKLPDDYDPSLSRALMGSQIPAEKQAQMQNDLEKAQILSGAKGKHMWVNPMDGQPYIVDAMSGEISKPGSSPGAASPVQSQQPAFGFNLSGFNPMTMKQQASVDSKRMEAFQNNKEKAQNALDILDAMEPNLKNFGTGSGGDIRMAGDKLGAMLPSSLGGNYFTPSADAANNIDKDANDLVTQLTGFQYVPGQRAGVAGLKNLQASKPGITNQPDTNANIISELRGRLNGYLTSEELAQAYKEASPLHVIDSNAGKLDDALKTVYPITTVDKDTGRIDYHPESVDRIRAAMPDAIANPQKYFQAAQQAKQPQSSADTTPGTSQLNARDIASALMQAKQAIAKGKDPAAVRARLQEHGIDPSQAGL